MLHKVSVVQYCSDLHCSCTVFCVSNIIHKGIIGYIYTYKSCFLTVHEIVKKYTADYDKALIFNKVHHELNQVCPPIVHARKDCSMQTVALTKWLGITCL